MSRLFKFLIILALFTHISGITSEIPSDLQCLTTNIFMEARGESLKGKKAIADVTLNRSKHSAFKGQDTLCKVVFAKGQFSWTFQQPKKRIQKLLSGDLRGFKDEDVAAYQIAEQIAAEALADGYKPLLPKWVVSFHNKSVQPSWSDTMKKYGTIGNHVFFGFKQKK